MKQSSNEIEKKGRDGTSGDVPVVKRITSSRVESVMNTDVCAREIIRHATVENTQTVLEEISNHTFDALAVNIKMPFLVGNGVGCSHASSTGSDPREIVHHDDVKRKNSVVCFVIVPVFEREARVEYS